MFVQNEFFMVNIYDENKFKSLVSELSEIKIPYYIHEHSSEEKSAKTYTVYIRYCIDESLCLIEAEELFERFSNYNITEINLYSKYYVAFAKAENDEYVDAPLIYNDDDVIIESDSFDEAAKAYDIVKKVYTGSKEVYLFAKLFDEDLENEDVLVCFDIIDSFSVM